MIDFTKNSDHLKIPQEEIRNPPAILRDAPLPTQKGGLHWKNPPNPLNKGESHQLNSKHIFLI
jgi:hypothetical protein